MAQFSIKEAVKFSLMQYGRHFVLLICGSVLFAGSAWIAHLAPHKAMEKLLGIHEMESSWLVITQDHTEQKKNKMSDEQQDTDNTQETPLSTDQSAAVLKKVHEITEKITARFQDISILYLLLIFLMKFVLWSLHCFMALGFMRLCLSLNDKNSGSYDLLFASTRRQVLRYIAALILFVLYLAVVTVGAALLTIPLAVICKGLLKTVLFVPVAKIGVVLIAFFWIAFPVGLLAWAVRYVFFGFCIVDKPNIGVRDSLSMSRDLSRGSRGRLIAAFILGGLLTGLVTLIVGKLFCLASAPSDVIFQVTGNAAAVSAAITSPFWISYCAYLYRALSGKTAKK